MTTLEPFEDNPHYFAIDGTPVFLLGATHEDGWYPISAVDHDYHRDLRRLDRVISGIDSPHVRGLVRVLPYSVKGGASTLQPWVYDPDEDTYDLDAFDPRWERRLESYLDNALARDIVVSLEVWDDWSVTRGPDGAYDPGPDAGWNAHPFNPANNRTYDALSEETAECGAPFYATVPPTPETSEVLDRQQAYVERLLEVTAPYDNIIYCLSNETRASLEWSTYWAEYVGERIGADGFVGDMPSTNRETGEGECDPALAPPTLIEDDRYGYVDISQAVSRHSFGDDPSREAPNAGRRIAEYYDHQDEHGVEKPLVVSKDYTNERPHAVSVICSKFVGGAASARFHRPLDEEFLGDWDREGATTVADGCFELIGSLGTFVADTQFWRLEPDPDLVSTADSSGNALALGEPGGEYVIQLFNWDGEPVRAPLEPATYQVRWFDPDDGVYLPADNTVRVDEAGERSFEPPTAADDLLLHLSAL